MHLKPFSNKDFALSPFLKLIDNYQLSTINYTICPTKENIYYLASLDIF